MEEIFAFVSKEKVQQTLILLSIFTQNLCEYCKFKQLYTSRSGDLTQIYRSHGISNGNLMLSEADGWSLLELH